MRPAAVLVAVGIGLGGCGFALATFTVSNTPITATGSYFNNTGLTYWFEVGLSTTTVPTPAPAALSTTVGTPTHLAFAATNYAINAVTAGNPALALRFDETTGAPTSTELELTFTISVGGSPATSTTKVYVETQTYVAGLYFTLYFQTGTISITHTTVTTVVQLSQRCTAIGTCP